MSEDISLNPMDSVTTDDLFKEISRRFPDGIVLFGLNPPGPEQEPVHVYANIKQDHTYALLAGYTALWFAQGAAGFFHRYGEEE